MTARQPVLFLSHGSPLTALGGDELNRTWLALAGNLSRPRAILMISAHWMTRVTLVSGAPTPATIHDFGGFPDELYALKYPAPGAPELAQRVKQQLTDAGIATGVDPTRGLDHGAWVPLMALFPQADVPVLQLSIQPERCARHHFALGAALSSLSDEGVLIIGSGHMTHNLMDWLRPPAVLPAPGSASFRDWAHQAIMQGDDEALFGWDQVSGAQDAHPSNDHFLPLFAALGAAGTGRSVTWVGGGWIENALAADNYLFMRQ